MSVLEFAKENPAFFSAVLLAMFWVLKSALGPMMSRIPCAVANTFAQGRLRINALLIFMTGDGTTLSKTPEAGYRAEMSC